MGKKSEEMSEETTGKMEGPMHAIVGWGEYFIDLYPRPRCLVLSPIDRAFVVSRPDDGRGDVVDFGFVADGHQRTLD